ncbi:hypothetical protein EXIGLDRAFT_832078 [Exidia glandulosa HHB12029]|uniref:F-box domain-containing protein n=1 Tax=Exidia glandulosa HHB12029 TaxID=1314781 RepID=A0A165M2T9_EXIGL|nr:hypothetical protein EXIGLDRAFT_832078 [Exidia glandulosa HHB12029]
MLEGDVCFAIWSDELLLQFFDYLTLVELLQASGVCRHWRQLALSHTAYWKHIEIRSARSSGLSQFIARLTRSLDRPVSVEINLGLDDPQQKISVSGASAVYDLLGNHLHHVERLAIRHWEAAEPDRILRTLRQPAPLLRHLDLWLGCSQQGGTYHLPVLPDDVFLGQVGPIASLRLNGIRLPAIVPVSFARITELCLVHSSVDMHEIPWLPTLFPLLSRLGLAGNIALPHPTAEDHTFWHRLDLLQLKFGQVCRRWQTWFPYLSAIRELKIARADDSVIDMFDQHLVGRLSLALQGDLRSFTATLTSHISGLVRAAKHARDTRQIVGHQGTWDGRAPPRHRLFELQTITHRISTLTFAAAIWNDFVGYFAVLPVLAQLSIVSGPNDPEFNLSKLRLDRCLRCPLLGSLSLYTHLPREEETSVISTFVTHGLQREPGPLVLQFTSFRLKGALDVFAKDIRVSVDGIVVRDIDQPLTNPPGSSV